jgi:DNA-binding response OmpR family regulator
MPDVILLDVMMPGMTGFEVCQRIRSDPKVAEIPIIVLTALDDRESMLNALKGGRRRFHYSKPFDRYELRARLLGITRLNRYHKLVQERANLLEAANASSWMHTRRPSRAGRMPWTCATGRPKVTVSAWQK